VKLVHLVGFIINESLELLELLDIDKLVALFVEDTTRHGNNKENNKLCSQDFKSGR